MNGAASHVAGSLGVSPDVEEEGLAELPEYVGTSVTGGTKKKRGRPSSSIWNIFCGTPNKPTTASATCQHCTRDVTVHKKSSKAQAHLLACHPFIAHMDIIDKTEWPEWYKPTKKSIHRASSVGGFPISQRSAVSSTSRSANSIASHFVPRLTKDQQDAMHSHLAMFFYLTSTSFLRIEEPELLNAVKVLRPDAELPDRKKLAGPLLTKCYDKVKRMTEAKLNRCVAFGCLASDGWSNSKNEPIVNYMLQLAVMSLFLESVSTGMQGHNAEWIAADLTRVITYLMARGTKICGAVTDNTATNKAAWKLLERKFPTMFFQGCTSHALHLLVKDIFGATKAKHGRAAKDYPPGYPFEPLLLFVQLCKDLVTFFTQHHKEQAQLVALQVARGVQQLVKSGDTRWGSIREMFMSLKLSFPCLLEMVLQADWVVGDAKQKKRRREVLVTVRDDQFLANLNKCIAILAPIDAAIVLFQNDKVPVSMVYQVFAIELPSKFHNMASNGDDSPLTHTENEYMQKLVNERREFVYGNASAFAYLLDPRFFGKGMPRTELKRAQQAMLAYSVLVIPDDGTKSKSERMECVLAEYMRFRDVVRELQTTEPQAYALVQSGKVSPKAWWKEEQDEFPLLCQISMRVFAMTPSSASAERNFSTMDFVHSKLRNKLGHKKVEKLVYIKTNFKQAGGAVVSEAVKDAEYNYDDEVVVVND